MRAFLRTRHKHRPSAIHFLQRHRRELCREVAEGAGAHSYAIHQMFIPMINRCRAKATPSPDRSKYQQKC
jgi:hypothetical protein